MGDEIVVLITAAHGEEAAALAKALVDEHLAACANIVPQIRSFFFWEGRTQDEQETLLIVKSWLPLMDRLIARVKSIHSYAVPEIIALPIIAGSQEYLAWLRENAKG